MRLALPAYFCVWLSTEQSWVVRQVQTAACADRSVDCAATLLVQKP